MDDRQERASEQGILEVHGHVRLGIAIEYIVSVSSRDDALMINSN